VKKIIFVVPLFAIAMISLSITQLGSAQQGSLTGNSIACPQGHSCQCNTSTGLGTDLTTGNLINNKCNDIASQVNSGWSIIKP